MARFAMDCQQALVRVTQELVDRLGPDTATLCMRIGLHSGSVTAGVLRGEKGRFQVCVCVCVCVCVMLRWREVMSILVCLFIHSS